MLHKTKRSVKTMPPIFTAAVLNGAYRVTNIRKHFHYIRFLLLFL